MIEKSKAYAIKCHKDRNQKYCNNLPYEYHLQLAVDIGLNFLKISGIPEEGKKVAKCINEEWAKALVYAHNESLKKK